MNIGTNSGTFWVMFGILLIFGLLYNWLISWLNKNGYMEGYTWLTVVIGTTVTLLAAIPVLGLGDVAYMFGLFAASGFFMAAGDIARYVQARRRAEGR